jgi:hypothetical protein
MTVAELDISPRTRGRPAKPVSGEVLREVTEADLALLASGRGVSAKPLAKLRDRHHALARCLAQGMKDGEAAAVTGYDPSRISILKKDPAFAELVEHYRLVEDSTMADFMDRATSLSLSAMAEIQDRLEDDPESLPTTTLLEIAKFAADRTGHAPVQKSVQINATVDMGARLAAARQRVQDARAVTPVIEATASVVEESGDSSVDQRGVRGPASS